jgi:hypothetical protein
LHGPKTGSCLGRKVLLSRPKEELQGVYSAYMRCCWFWAARGSRGVRGTASDQAAPGRERNSRTSDDLHASYQVGTRLQGKSRCKYRGGGDPRVPPGQVRGRREWFLDNCPNRQPKSSLSKQSRRKLDGLGGSRVDSEWGANGAALRRLPRRLDPERPGKSGD